MVSATGEWARPWEYARCTVQLQDDVEVAGAEALFDQALSNGLAAIIAAEWPGKELRSGGKIKSAFDLLGTLESRVQATSPGVVHLTFIDGTKPGEVIIATALLREGVKISQPIRHAKPSQGSRLRTVHVEALVALDEHPALRRLDDEHFDELWVRETRADRLAQERAAWYVDQLKDTAPEEWAKRTNSEYVEQFLPWDLKERYGSPGPEYCPVCEQESLIVAYLDDYGSGVGAGTCCVCGYTRTEFVANDEGQTAAIQRQVEKDD